MFHPWVWLLMVLVLTMPCCFKPEKSSKGHWKWRTFWYMQLSLVRIIWYLLLWQLSKLCKKEEGSSSLWVFSSIFVAKGLCPPENSLSSKAKHISKEFEPAFLSLYGLWFAQSALCFFVGCQLKCKTFRCNKLLFILHSTVCFILVCEGMKMFLTVVVTAWLRWVAQYGFTY